jgi:hypothetical protein
MELKQYNLFQGADKIFQVEPADFKRDWMDAYPHNFAYRCLPLKIANESGWVVKSPIDFKITYLNDEIPKDSIFVEIDEKDSFYRKYILSHFGRGVLTFSLPYLFQTPEPWSLWVRGYPNHYKENVSFLEGVVETYWLQSTFTYNIRLVEKNKPVQFKKGEPLFFFTLVNLKDLQNSKIKTSLISEDKELKDSYDKWNASRAAFLARKDRTPDEWQKDYFLGKKTDGTTQCPHLTSMKLNE